MHYRYGNVRRIMNLIEFLKAGTEKLDSSSAHVARVAKKAGTSPQYLYLIALGHKRPGPTLALKIVSATGNEVSKESLRPDIWGHSEKAAA